jgi:hypothetical protein
MRNKDFIKKVVIDELNIIRENTGPMLTETVSQWPVIQQIFKSNNIKPTTYRGMETYSYNDDTLGQLSLFNDGTAYLEHLNKIVPWTIKGQDIVIDNDKISIQQINKSIQSTNKYYKTVSNKKTANVYKQLSGIDKFQTLLDWLGIIPGFGDIIDAANALIYFARGKYLDGVLSLIAIIPVVGSGIKLGFKGAISAGAGAYKAARIWKKAAEGSTDELVSFYRTAVESGSLTKLQLADLAKYGDFVASLLNGSKRTIRNKEAALSLIGVDAKSVLKQIDDVILVLKNTTSTPIKKSLLSKLGTAVKASKTISKTLNASKVGLFTLANLGTLGGLGVVRNLVRKLGITKREMGYLKNAMDLRFINKISQSPTTVYALFKSNGPLKAAEAASIGIPPWLQSRSSVEIRNWFVKVQETDPKKWKQITEYIGTSSANKKNEYYMTFVGNKFQQASNIFRPGVVFKSGKADWIAGALRLDSYRLSNPKNLDIVKNEIEDLAEKLGYDKQDDANGVIMPAIFAAYSEFIGEPNKSDVEKLKSPGLTAAGILGAIGVTSNQAATNSMPGSKVVDNDAQSQGAVAIQTDFKEAPGTTTDKLDALYDKGYEESEINALKKVLEID